MKAIKDGTIKITKDDQLITYCPGNYWKMELSEPFINSNIILVDCVWANWQAWSPCPDCHGSDSGIYDEDLPEYEQVRQRVVKIRAKHKGKKCRTPVELQSRVGNCTTKTVPQCPEVAGGSFEGQWSEWTKCLIKCGQEGVKKRVRQCYGGGKCKGSLEETVRCKEFCPPCLYIFNSRFLFAHFTFPLLTAGWSKWDYWSNCPVTCGSAQRARRRVCLDDDKEEFKGKLGKSTCKGIARETQRCDMGKCGSKQELEFEGGNKNPVDSYIEKALQKEPENYEEDTSPHEESQPNTVAPQGKKIIAQFLNVLSKNIYICFRLQ